MTFRTAVINGRVVDGTGAATYGADILISGDSIAHIAAPGAAPQTAEHVIDAQGLVVTPGFVDMHSHADFSVLASPAAETQLRQGVTTLVTGNCGASPFPTRSVRDTEREYAYLDAEFAGEWEGAESYIEAVRSAQSGVNLVLQVGHGSLRSYVMGYGKRQPNEDELDGMRYQIEQAAAFGIRGISTGLIYDPGSFADDGEILALAESSARCGLLYSSHIRNESDALIDAVGEAIHIGERTGVRVEVSHLKAMGKPNHGAVAHAIELLHIARERGVDVAADVYPYTASCTRLSARLPEWAKDGGAERFIPRLSEPAFRAGILREFERQASRDLSPADVVIAAAPGAADPGVIGASGVSFIELAERMNCEPAEAMVRALEATNGRVAVVNHAIARSDLETVIADDMVCIGSDGWTLATQGSTQPHPRSFGTYPTVIRDFVVDNPVLSLESAVRKMTSAPAERIGVSDRGVIREGAKADIAVFDPLQFTSRSTYSSPWQLAEGMEHLLVNGHPAITGGMLTGHRHGRII